MAARHYKPIQASERHQQTSRAAASQLDERLTQQLKRGALGRVGEALIRQCSNKQERQTLQKFANSVFQNIDPVVLSGNTGDVKFITAVLDALPSGDEFSEDRRGVVIALEKDGLNMSILDISKDTPLLRAIKTDNRGALDALLHTQGCDINATDKYSTTCLIYAVQRLDVDTVKTILRRFPTTVNLDKYDYANYTALAYAASFDNLELCTYLLEAGARVDVNSNSPLFLAVRNGASQELVHLLISHGSSVNVSNSNGLNALAFAAKNKRTDTVTLLLESGANCTPDWFRNIAFMTALGDDHLETLLVLKNFGVDITGRDHKGASIVHACCVDGSSAFLQHVISTTNIDLNSHSRQRQTAAHVAAFYDHDLCLLTLFQAGADCWSEDPRGQTALEIAIFHNRGKCVDFFVKHPVFPKQKLFSILHMLRNNYDQEALGRKPAFAMFEQLLQTLKGEEDQVDSLFNICVIHVRRFLGQKHTERVSRLPLPEKVKSKLVSFA